MRERADIAAAVFDDVDFKPVLDRLDLRPHVAAEGLGLDRGQDHRHFERPGCFTQNEIVVDDRLAIEIADAEQHLRLQVDDGDHAVIGCQQTLLAELWAVFGHDELGHVKLDMSEMEANGTRRAGGLASTAVASGLGSDYPLSG